MVPRELAAAQPCAWSLPSDYTIGGCFVCGAGDRGVVGEPGCAGAALAVGSRIVSSAAVQGQAGYPYEPGLLALREGPLLEAAVRALPVMPDVLLVNATGRDHPLRAGLALHLGAVLELPTVGVTHRPCWPARVAARRGGRPKPLMIGVEQVGCWVRTRRHARPLAVHPAWRTNLDTACAVVLGAVGAVRAPQALREARRIARRTRAGI